MDFLKKLLGGFGGGSQGGGRNLYFYIKPNGCQEVVRIRVDMHNEPSQADDNSTYFVRKTARGTSYKCTRSAELYLTFDSGRRLQNTEVTGGTQVTEADYNAWVASQEAPSA